jgi:hypothetical protein
VHYTLTISLVAFVVVCLVGSEASASNVRFFSPRTGISAKLTVEKSQVTYEVSMAKHNKVDQFTVETEKPLKIDVADYNFDGYEDFSISHADDGMGIYTISSIFVYSPKEVGFLSLRPKCGDEFINVVLNKNKGTLINSYFEGNRMISCARKY